MKIVALAGPGNGHTYLIKTGDSTSDFFVAERNTPAALANLAASGFGQLPVGFYMFKDALYIRSATADYADLLGARVLRIGHSSVAAALQAAGELVAKDNSPGQKAQAPRYLAVPEILLGLGITDTAQAVPIEVEMKSGIVKRELRRIALNSSANRDMRGDATAPLYLRHLDRYFFAQEIPEKLCQRERHSARGRFPLHTDD